MSTMPSNDHFLDAFFSVPNTTWPNREGSHPSATYLERFLGALDERGEAPLVLPRKDSGWPTACAYIVCWTPSHAARMRTLIYAAVAQNWAEFDGRLARLRADDPIDAAVLAAFGASTTYVLRPPTPSAQQGMFTALNRLVSTLEHRPPRISRIVRPVGRLLRDFETSLAAGQAATSLELLEDIERTGGISHENIAFLRIRRLGQLGEDDEILQDAALPTVVLTEPPRMVREAILAAWYRASTRDRPDSAELVDRMRAYPADIALLVDGSLVMTDSADAWAAAAIVALARGDASLADGLLGNEVEAPKALRGLLDEVARKSRHPSPYAAPAEERSRATEAESPESEPVAEMEATDTKPAVNSWLSWLASLHSDHADSPEVDLAATWPAPGEVDAELATAIDELPDSAATRLFAGLGAIIDCDEYAKPAWRTSEALIRRHLVGDSLTPSDLGAISALMAIFLRGGPNVDAYRDVLDYLTDKDFRGRWASVATAPAAIDIADLVVTSPSADRTVQQSFVSTALDSLHAQRHRLTEADRVLGELATSDVDLQWDWSIDTDTDTENEAESEANGFPESILLYSLETAVLARAKAAVERLYPGVHVSVSSAKVGNDTLRDQTRRARLIVLATRRATHAATGFIQAHAREARIAYADGCGSGSMMRAIEKGLRFTDE
ncbi:hypothetical protein EV187_2928 [Agromyces ramosus]|uniref:Uncharacterized protein n=1 Tax=Agromyces ramosus TaxID=33879 RepID=A0A4Q7MA24_9MICO|nr:hypothetical protein [Agromyces ramosus]RZS64541.1 hypothetical protein EV187_2928 [Agromyces ramosus]